MRCPRCAMELVERTRVGVAVDICGRCRGVWFDRGELEKVLAALREGEQERALWQAEGRASHGDGRAHDGRKREVWGRLLELFD
jgi:uncharacterized protein